MTQPSNSVWTDGKVLIRYSSDSESCIMKFTELKEILVRSGLDTYELAVLSHYLQNYEVGHRNIYASEARKILKKVDRQIDPGEIRWNIPFPATPQPKFTFIDLFAGIGGMRTAFQSLGGKCVFSSEWDTKAQETYFANFGEVPFGDITKIETSRVPRHEILVAGFPCQAFSIAGARGGFDDTRGTLFFDVARLIEAKKPEAFLLENVKGLKSHDRGRTLATILNTLRDDLGYYVPDPEIVNARNFGVPQNRERIFIVGFRRKSAFTEFTYPVSAGKDRTINDIKESEEVSVKYYMSTQYLRTLEEHRRRHEAKGNGFGFEIIPDDGVANAIVVGGMGRERNLVIDHRLTDFRPVTKIKGEVNRRGIRRMTPREWARLQGFPDKFIIPVSDAQAYKQFGNSVAVPAIAATGKKILKALEF